MKIAASKEKFKRNRAKEFSKPKKKLNLEFGKSLRFRSKLNNNKISNREFKMTTSNKDPNRRNFSKEHLYKAYLKERGVS